MNSDNYFKIKEDARKMYKEIGNVQCPILNNEIIYFSDIGFRHLVYKGKWRRKIRDQIRRFRILRYAKDVVRLSTKYTYKNIPTETRIVHFWSIRTTFDGFIIIMIIRQIDNGRKHFFSIMDKKI